MDSASNKYGPATYHVTERGFYSVAPIYGAITGSESQSHHDWGSGTKDDEYRASVGRSEDQTLVFDENTMNFEDKTIELTRAVYCSPPIGALEKPLLLHSQEFPRSDVFGFPKRRAPTYTVERPEILTSSSRRAPSHPLERPDPATTRAPTYTVERLDPREQRAPTYTVERQ